MFICQKDTECYKCGAEIPTGAWFEPTDDDGDLCQDCYDNLQISRDIAWDTYKESK